MSSNRHITPAEAISLLTDGDDIHTFRNPGPSALIGADIRRERIIEVINANPDTLQIGGETSRNMKHALVLEDEIGLLFIATDEEKLNIFDPLN